MALIKMKRTNKETGEVVHLCAGWNQAQAETTLKQHQEAHGDEFTYEIIGERPTRGASADEQVAVHSAVEREMRYYHSGNFCPDCGSEWDPRDPYCEVCG